MKLILLFVCFLATMPRWALSEIQLVSSGPRTVRPGDNLNLVCKVTGFSITTHHYFWHWIRQPPGKSLEWIAIIYAKDGSRTFSHALKSRTSVSSDASTNQVFLQLNSLTSADSAAYFCVREYYGGWFDTWGEGTFVTVTSATQSGPSLFPLILNSNKIPSDGHISIGCLAKDVPPALVRFTWEDHNNASINASHIRQYPTTKNSAGTFTASSLAVVSAADWKNLEPFYCKAEGVVGVARVVRQASEMEPTMIIRAPRRKDFMNPTVNATIFCKAEHLDTESTTIQWLKDGSPLDSGFTTSGPVAMGCSGYSIFSELAVSKTDWSADRSFSCRVQNEMFSDIKNISLSMTCDPVFSDCNGVPRLVTIPPSFADIYLTKSANLTCRISNLLDEVDAKDLEVTWTKMSDSKKLEARIGQAKQEENNAMFFVDVAATICQEEWDSGDTFECKVTHPRLATAERRTLTKHQGGTPRAPTVYVLSPPPEQLALRETATITCLLKDFYPDNFFVKWLWNNEPVAASEYFVSKAIKESKSQEPERYSAYSMLNVKEQDLSDGVAYTCMVGHEALPYQTTQKTIDKNSGKPTHVNVSLVLSDMSYGCH